MNESSTKEPWDQAFVTLLSTGLDSPVATVSYVETGI